MIDDYASVLVHSQGNPISNNQLNNEHSQYFDDNYSINENNLKSKLKR